MYIPSFQNWEEIVSCLLGLEGHHGILAPTLSQGCGEGMSPEMLKDSLVLFSIAFSSGSIYLTINVKSKQSSGDTWIDEGKRLSLNGPTQCFCCLRGSAEPPKGWKALELLHWLSCGGEEAWNIWSEGHLQSYKEGKEVTSRIKVFLAAQYVPGRKGREDIPAPWIMVGN